MARAEGVSTGNKPLRASVAAGMLVRMLNHTLTAAQVAEESGVNKRTVQYQLLRGLLKGRQVPGSNIWLIDRDDFEAWLSSRTNTNKEEDQK